MGDWGIYLCDGKLPNDYNGSTPPRRTIDDIYSIITEIVPIPPKSIKEQRLGFVIYYENDKDVNFIYRPEISQKLADKDFAARLVNNTEDLRAVYILRTTPAIYHKDHALLTAEIEQRNNIIIKQLETFPSNKNQKLYIKLTLESKEARDNLIEKGSIQAFHATLPARAKISSSPQSGTSGGRGGAGASAAPAPGYPYPRMTPGAAPPPATYRNPSGMHQGRALSSTSSWAGPRTQLSSTPNPASAQISSGLLPNPPGLVHLQQQNSEFDIKSFMVASIVLAETMTEGVEQPEALLSNFNGIIQSHGYPPIQVPQDILDSARIIYHNKFQIDNNFHTQALFHHQHPQTSNQPPPQRRAPFPSSTPLPISTTHLPSATHMASMPITTLTTATTVLQTATQNTSTSTTTTTSLSVPGIASQASRTPLKTSSNPCGAVSKTTTSQASPPIYASASSSTSTSTSPASSAPCSSPLVRPQQTPIHHPLTSSPSYSHRQSHPSHTSTASPLYQAPLNTYHPSRPTLNAPPSINNSPIRPSHSMASPQGLTSPMTTRAMYMQPVPMHPIRTPLSPTRPPTIPPNLTRTPTASHSPQTHRHSSPLIHSPLTHPAFNTSNTLLARVSSHTTPLTAQPLGGSSTAIDLPINSANIVNVTTHSEDKPKLRPRSSK